MNGEWQNKLYFGDNLEILRDHVADESVDLIYLDPPFNSKATYSVLFKEKNGTASAAQVADRKRSQHSDLHLNIQKEVPLWMRRLLSSPA